jgi:cyclohexanecarboxylate-CoA ligase
MPTFRERELSFMLDLAESKVLIVPRIWRNFDHGAMASALSRALPRLRHVLVIGGQGTESFEAVWADAGDERESAALFAARRPAADDVMQLLFTSGTTGEPKCVMHTANTLLSIIPPYGERLRLAADDVVLMVSPLAHQIGFMYGLMMPIMLGATAVLQDIWEPRRTGRLIARERISYTMASTPFLSDLAETVATEGGYDVSSLRLFQLGGAPVPRDLVVRATEILDAHIISSWGMTETGAVTISKPDDPPEKVFHTDGCALAGMELRVVDASNRPLPAGPEGHLQVRGCANFVGYLKRPHYHATDADGWFDTGDLARMDEDGYIRITGRTKDIIIRGGENIPVVEIENLIRRHPAVQDIAIVGAPDARLGERACAFVVPKNGASLSLQNLVEFLLQQKVAKTYLPERLELAGELPRTPSGKIQNFKLRQIASEGVAAATERSCDRTWPGKGSQ